MGFRLLLLVQICLGFISISHAQDIPGEIDKLHQTVEKHRYRTNRDLTGFNSYEDNLGPQFLPALRQLVSGQRWLDIGAGEGNAIVDYLEKLGGPASVLGMSVEVPFLSRKDIRAKYGSQFDFVTGKYLEEYSQRELGHFDLITDVFGAVSYAPHLDVVMASIGQLLKPTGVAFTLIQIGDPEKLRGGQENLKLVDAQARPVPLQSWLSAFRCLTATATIIPGASDEVVPANSLYSVRVMRTCDAIQVPTLVLLDYQMATPPHRLYRYLATEKN